ncbi:PAS domain S-box protein [Nafulsella turpanensis]|uniref:PAS domain S-box protein n=1 Tax=Nafulsella turpanensis TaxID=1265690 RepID=UPI000348214B|nr:PAS domain S-box protein [Nafulsella turpanensis]
MASKKPVQDNPSFFSYKNSKSIEGVEMDEYGQVGNIEDFPLAVCILDQKGCFVRVNEHYCRLYGYSRQELLGQHFTLLLPPAQKRAQTGLHDAFILKAEEPLAELEVLHKNGQSIYVKSHAVRLFNQQQEPFVINFVTDITSLKEQELALKNSLNEKHQHAEVRETAEGMLMHDMRKPVANIISICNLLMNVDYNKDKIQHWIKVLKVEAQKSLKLLDTRAGFIKIEMNNFQPELTTFDLISLTRKIVEPLEPVLQKRKLQISLSVDGTECGAGDSLMIEADPFFIEIMLNNLMVNAVEASPDRGEVKFQLHIRNKQDLQTDIYNKGVIPEAIRKTFFDKYTTLGKTNGLGLGTYTAKLIVQAHGGHITFLTSEEGGTTLKIFLPAVVKEFSRGATGSKD